MLSTSLDLAGLAALVAGVLVLTSAGFALLAGGLALLYLALAADGVQPVAAARAAVLGRIARRRAAKNGA